MTGIWLGPDWDSNTGAVLGRAETGTKEVDATSPLHSTTIPSSDPSPPLSSPSHFSQTVENHGPIHRPALQRTQRRDGTGGSRTMTITQPKSTLPLTTRTRKLEQGPGGKIVGSSRTSPPRLSLTWFPSFNWFAPNLLLLSLLNNHKPRLFDQSSDESDSDSDSDCFCSGNPAHNHANHNHSHNQPQPVFACGPKLTGVSIEWRIRHGAHARETHRVRAQCIREAAKNKKREDG
ncbi:hypothetical protein D9613_012442 [Agrocybe pediades]|uniref:Uncharacterized protein n=1 Tax=Agrocybe pediades TaxID=84607 RepID=A0A8H4QSB7_9AGAR|nr:hypothetical protein D9613_012442 [Agrocybe pediades]